MEKGDLRAKSSPGLTWLRLHSWRSCSSTGGVSSNPCSPWRGKYHFGTVRALMTSHRLTLQLTKGVAEQLEGATRGEELGLDNMSIPIQR
jgi:hypothetical protein